MYIVRVAAVCKRCPGLCFLVSYKPLARMIIGNYTADDSVGETAPSPISPEPWCRKDTIRGGRVLDGGDACHVSAGDSPAGVGVGYSISESSGTVAFRSSCS